MTFSTSLSTDIPGKVDSKNKNERIIKDIKQLRFIKKKAKILLFGSGSLFLIVSQEYAKKLKKESINKKQLKKRIGEYIKKPAIEIMVFFDENNIIISLIGSIRTQRTVTRSFSIGWSKRLINCIRYLYFFNVIIVAVAIKNRELLKASILYSLRNIK